jgi:hypothetical protein
VEIQVQVRPKRKRVSLGVYPDVGLKDARERRDQARKLLTNGIDPSENRKARKAAQITGLANTFEAVAREWFAKYESSWVKSTVLVFSVAWKRMCSLG